MLKRFVLLRLLAFVLLPSLAAAQFTLVSGTVNDPNSLHYSYGTLTAKLVISGSPVITASNTPYSPPTQPVGLDVNGSFTMQLASNSALTPSGSTWTFSVCSTAGTVPPAFGTGPQCFTVTGITISGSTQSISSTLSAAAPALTVNFGNGTGTVTTFSSGSLPPLFTTSVATANTTPALSFTLTAAGANTLYGNFTGSSAGPTFGSVPSCSGANQALNWTAGTGFGCVTISGSGGIGGSGTANFIPEFTASTTIGNSPLEDVGPGTYLSSTERLNLVYSGLNNIGALVSVSPASACAGTGTNPASFDINVSGPSGCGGIFGELSSPNTTSATGAQLGVISYWYGGGGTGSVSNAITGAGVFGIGESNASGNLNWVAGVAGNATTFGATGTLANISGVVGVASLSNSSLQTATLMAGVDAQVKNDSTTVTQPFAAAFLARSPSVSSITSHTYGLYIQDQTVGGGTNNPNPFGIFEANTTEKNQLGALTLASITGSTQCLHASSTGAVTGTGSDCGSGGSTSLNSITAATANGSAQNSGNFNLDWQWKLTSTTDGLDITEPSASTGTGSLVNITSLATSTATPLTLSTGTSTATALNIASGVLILPVGTPTNPSIAFAGHTQNGLHCGGASCNYVAFSDQSSGTQESVGLDDQSLRVADVGAVRWTNGDINASFDTCADRQAAGILGIDTTSACNTAGYAGALQLTNIFNYGQEYFPASAGSGITNAPGVGGASATVGEFCVNGVCSAGWGASGLRVTNTGAFKFMSAGLTSTIEAGLSYDGSGVVIDAGNGTAGDTSGSFKGTSFIGAGSNGGYVAVEGTCANAAAVAGSDVLCPNATDHWWEISGNGSTLEPAAGINGSVTANHFATFKNANEIQDGGATIPLSALATQAANSLVANVTGGTAAPTAAAIPSGIQNYVAGTGYNQATAHQMAAPRSCSDSSGSGTAQSCSTTPTFSPASGDEVIYTTTTANTGALTVNVNASAADAVQKWQGTALASGDIKANTPVLLVFDGSHWQVQNIGNAPSGGSSAWSAISNPSGNLSLTMGTDTSTFNYSSALANAFEFANTTAATSGTAQSSPLLTFAGFGWDGGTPASVASSVTMGWAIPNGANQTPAFIITPTTSSTSGNVTFNLAPPFNSLEIGGSAGTILGQSSLTATANSGFTVLTFGGNLVLKATGGSAENTQVLAGAVTGANAQGWLQLQQSYFTASALGATAEVVCGTTTAFEVAACTAGENNVIGVAQTIGGTNTQLFVATAGSVTTLRFDGTPVLGDIACSPPTSTGTTGLAHDNATTACTLGENLGVVIGNVSGSGSGATATVTLR